MVLMMWAQTLRCILSSEAPRRLVLSREMDREHLTTDLASVDRTAVPVRGLRPSDDQQPSRFIDCEATEIQQIANTHGVSPGQLRAQWSGTRSVMEHDAQKCVLPFRPDDQPCSQMTVRDHKSVHFLPLFARATSAPT
jgi:hypothetical protein